MQILLAMGVTLLTATAPNQAQAAAASTPITITFVKASFEEAVSAISRMSGVAIEIDQTIPDDVRREPIGTTTITLRGATFRQALEFLTTAKGLDYSIVDARTVKIFKER